jgi:hypothetical protein
MLELYLHSEKKNFFIAWFLTNWEQEELHLFHTEPKNIQLNFLFIYVFNSQPNGQL